MKSRPQVKGVNLIGTGRAGVWCLIARALAGDAVNVTIADADGFDFRSVKSMYDEDHLPGALRYGGLWALTALAAPADVRIYNTGQDALPSWLSDAWKACGARPPVWLKGQPPRGMFELLSR